MSTDPVIENRIILGETEMKKLNYLTVAYLKWINSAAKENPEERELTYQKLVQNLELVEFNMLKLDYIVQMNEEETLMYAELLQQTDQQIAQSINDISDAKSELVEETRKRKHRQEYDALATTIQVHPAREGTLRETEDITKEIQKLAETRARLEEKFERRRKEFQLLLHAARELQKSLEDDSTTTEESTSVTINQDQSSTKMEMD